MVRAGKSRLPSSELRVAADYFRRRQKSYVLPPVNVPRWRARSQKICQRHAATFRSSLELASVPIATNPAASQGPGAVPPVSAMSDRYGLTVGNCGGALEGVIRNIERENVLI